MDTLSTLVALCEGKSPLAVRCPLEQTSNAELLRLLWCYPEQAFEQIIESVIADEMTRDVTVMS